MKRMGTFKNIIFKIMGLMSHSLNLYKYKVELTSNNPTFEDVKDGTIILVGGNDYAKWAYLKCPCGCNELIMMSLVKDNFPNWDVTLDKFGRPSIFPSINKTTGCRSHFWIKKGKIIWAKY